MPRARRIHLENAVYYITLEGPSNDRIFRDRSDFLKYTELLAKYKSEYQFNLFSYALLTDYIYLLIEPNGDFTVPQIMQKITPNYTKYYNAKYNRSGHLFAKRYRSVYVEKDYLLRLTRFVHMIPEKFQAGRFQEYPYSSFGAFSGASSLSMTNEVNEISNYLRASGNGDYVQFMNSQTAEEFEFLEKKLSRGIALGTEAFEEAVKEKIKEVSQKKEPEQVASETVSQSNPYGSFSPIRKTTLLLSGILVLTVAGSIYSFNPIHAPVHTKAPVAQQVQAKSAQPVATVAKQIKKQEQVDLKGTIWEVELITKESDGSEKQIKDKIRFTGSGFESYYFMNQGFNPSNYTVNVNQSGIITWETVQRNERGESITWHGDWDGKQMEGVMSYRPQGQTSQDFSFLSMGGKNG